MINWELVGKVDCQNCPDRDMCDQVKYDCPKLNEMEA